MISAAEQKLLDFGLVARRPEFMDSTMVSDYWRCPSMFYLRHVLGLKLKRHKSDEDVPLDWGGKWHRMQEVYNKTQSTVAAIATLNEWPIAIQGATDKHGRSRQRMGSLFFKYLSRWKDLDRDVELIRQEQYFDVFDDELGLRWCGRLDRVIRQRSRIKGWDYKTTSYMDRWFWDKFEFGVQLPGYVWAIRKFTTEYVSEMVVDVIYTLKESDEFFRKAFRYDDEFLAEWAQNVKSTTDEINRLLDEHLHEPEKWRKHWISCIQFNKACRFAEVHFYPPKRDSRLIMLRDDYRVDRWDPRTEEYDNA